jgi:transposase
LSKAVTALEEPWARHGAGHTIAFDEMVAWLATQCSKTAVTALMRIAWGTVGAIITRVWADIDAVGDRLDGLTRIGIDEISYKRGRHYLTPYPDVSTHGSVSRDSLTLVKDKPGHVV